MAGARKGNQNARKHGLYAKARPSATLRASETGETPLHPPSFAMRYLEEAMEEIFARMEKARGQNFVRLANALSMAATSLFSGHRTMAYLSGGISPIEDAMKELQSLDFSED